MHVDVFDESGAAMTTVDAATQTLQLKAVKAGHLLVQCFSSGCGAGHGVRASNNVNASLDIRIVVVNATPIPSLDLIELASLLEITFVTRRPVYRNAKCFQPQNAAGLYKERRFSESDEAALTREWREVKKMLLQ